MASGVGSDRTFNKVALCSAIFAGFAYVGYSVVRTAFNKRRTEAELSYPEGEARLYFRRLSQAQATQTNALLGMGNLEGTEGGRIILRPLSVQERIRELNFRARHFADTMLALQSNGGPPIGRHGAHPMGPRSLQCSPWSSPRILSPVDIEHFIASRSSDNLSLLPLETGSPVRKRWSRRSLARKSLSPEVGMSGDDQTRETDRAIKDISDELKEKLESLSLRGRTMDAYEAKTLVALLYTSDEGVLERALVTLANLATFEINQNNLREAGCLSRLQNLLVHPKSEVRLATIRALGNMALNEQNQKEIKPVVSMLLSYTDDVSKHPEELIDAVLTTLANVAMMNDWHEEFSPSLHRLYSLIDQESLPIRLQSLKLLVNLSTNADMVPSLFAAHPPQRLVYLMDVSEEREIVLRLVTLLANLICAANIKSLKTEDLPVLLDDNADTAAAASNDNTMYSAVFGEETIDKVQDKAKTLMNLFDDEDVRNQSRKLFNALKARNSKDNQQDAASAPTASSSTTAGEAQSAETS